MPVLPAMAGVLKHQIMFLTHNEWSVMTLWTGGDAAGDYTPRVTAERTQILGWLTAQWKNAANNITEPRSIKSWSMHTSPPTKFTEAPATSVGFGTKTSPLPPQLAVAVSLRSQPVGSAIRGRNGRIFHGWLYSSVIDNNTPAQIGTDDQALLVTAYEDLKTRLSSVLTPGNPEWGFIGRQLDLLPNVAFVPVDHVLVNLRIDVQRRRAPRQQSYAIGS